MKKFKKNNTPRNFNMKKKVLFRGRKMAYNLFKSGIFSIRPQSHSKEPYESE